jgi:hypothetical protein
MDLWKSEGIAPPFLTSALDGGAWLASRPCLFITGETAPPSYPNKKFGHRMAQIVIHFYCYCNTFIEVTAQPAASQKALSSMKLLNFYNNIISAFTTNKTSISMTDEHQRTFLQNTYSEK